MLKATVKIFAIFLFLFGVQHAVLARPHEREKRVSDSHLSNLETVRTLNKYKRRLAQTTPIDLNGVSSFDVNKRLLSSPYLSDLQTQIAARDNLRGIAIKIPVAAGMLNPQQIGRKRRSDPQFVNPFLQQSGEYVPEKQSSLNYEENELDQNDYQFPFLEYFKIDSQEE